MLPLTSSLYVSGEVSEVEKVLVDIGTGYYVEVGGVCKALPGTAWGRVLSTHEGCSVAWPQSGLGQRVGVLIPKQ